MQYQMRIKTLVAKTGLALLATSAGAGPLGAVETSPAPQDAGPATGVAASNGPAKSVSATGAHTLSQIVVNGARSDPNGYVAKQSSAATKTDTPLHETPQAISVISREQLDERNVTNLNDAMHYTAGVATYYSNDTRNDSFNIRGFSSDFFYLDGTRLPAVPSRALDQWRVDPYQLQSIAVVKGPASVEYGLGEPGGLVSMVSKMPTEDARGQVDFLAGSYDHFRLGVDTSGPLDSDKTVLYRFVAAEDYSQNQVESVHGTRTLLAPSLTFRPSEDTSLTVMASYLRDDTMDSNNFLPYYGTVEPTQLGQRISTRLATSNPGYEGYDKTQASLSYLFVHKLSADWTFKQNLRYSHLYLDNHALFGYSLSANQQTIQRAVMSLQSSFNDIDLDNQLLGKWSTGAVEHSLLLGFNYTNQNFIDNEGYTYTGYALNLYDPVALRQPVTAPPYNDTQVREVQRQFGVYLQDQMQYDQWRLVLSGRQDWVSSRNDDHLAGTTSSQDNSAFSGRAALMYLFDVGLAPYVSYSTSFQPEVGVNAYGAALLPLKSKQIEWGLKYQPGFIDANFSAALFDLRQNNTLTDAPNPELFGSVQTGQVRSRGVELEATASLSQSLKLLAAYTLQDVKITEGSADDPTVGKTPTAIPRTLGSLWLDYAPVGGTLDGFGLGMGAQYVGRSYANTGNTLQVGSFTSVDAALHYQTGNWRFVLSANNLLDRIYVARCGSVTRCQYGQRENVMITARYSW